MGQHKYNPIALAAKNGELPPKPSKIGSAEAQRRLYEHITNYMLRGGIFSGQDGKYSTISKSLRD